MKELEFWQHKLRQLRAEEAPPQPTWLVQGADCPLLGATTPIRERGVITHPWQPGVRLTIDTSAVVEPQFPATSPDEARLAFVRLWRGQLQGRGTRELRPADERCPDHPAFSRRRLAAALAFADGSSLPDARTPCLVRISVHGVQRFIQESRKFRDLWTACMIFGELVWAAMEPLIEHYGPDAILYPDLLGNPLLDQWLLGQKNLRDCVPQHIRDAGAPTAAVPVPNTFTALLPRGGPTSDHLLPLEELMQSVEGRIVERWRHLVQAGAEWVEKVVRSGPWRGVYDRSCAAPPHLSWVALAWPAHPLGVPVDLPFLPGRALDPERDTLSASLQRREQALKPWVPARAWRHYEKALAVFSRTGTAEDRRAWGGFDYPLAHHQLLRMHDAHKLRLPVSFREEPGEKCTVTGRHEALSNRPARLGATVRLGEQRQAARDFWQRFGQDDSGTVAERLGGPATLKRYLARSDNPGGLTRRWNGVDQPLPAPEDLTAPFPSSAGLAAYRFFEAVASAWTTQPRLRSATEEFLGALRATSSLEQETQHSRSLPRLSRFFTWADPVLKEFLRTEAQYLSPAVLQHHRDQASGPAGQELDTLIASVKRLRGAAAEVLTTDAEPQCEYAVLAMDADGMSRLLIGDPDLVKAKWRDILHPEIVRQIEQEWREDKRVQSNWLGLLEQPRSAGPSFHSTLTRALAEFVDTLAPWVIEVEFCGRLVYAGGDDLLALLPAAESIAAATRLQQLLSAPFVVDTQPTTPPWASRRGLSENQIREAPWRFRAVKGASDLDPESLGFIDHIEHPVKWPSVHPPPLLPATSAMRVFPMLGRAHSLSAGIVFGHFKTPLSRMLQLARANLEERAKPRTKGLVTRTPQGHLSISRVSRGGGVKASYTAPWYSPEEPAAPTSAMSCEPPNLAARMDAWTKGFRSNALPARLPYTLLQRLELLIPAIRGEDFGRERHRLLAALVAQEAPEALQSLQTTIAAGVLAGAPTDAMNARDMVGGLLVARHFAKGGEDE